MIAGLFIQRAVLQIKDQSYTSPEEDSGLSILMLLGMS